MAHLPIARTKTIMKTTDGADSISKEAILLTTRATELFIKELAKAGEKDMKNRNETKVNYSNLVNVVHNHNKYGFLEYMIPKKITVREYKELMRKKESGSSEESEDDSSSSNDSSSDSTSEEN